ncbi:MAG: hypothetical protein AMJ69_05380 [Gammaproteobacteria bacterium SG8_47]|nr:MAG: hypothetical protein AMJ69_05380 [Gammaproteobacteria bacterium SG8_47]
MTLTRRALALLGLWVLIGVVVSLWPAWLLAWQMYGVVLAGVLLADAGLVWNSPRFVVERNVMRALPIGVWSKVQLRIHNPGSSSRLVEVFDCHPPEAEQRGLPRPVRLPAFGWAEIGYRLRPLRRGALTFKAVQLRVHSPGRLWRRALRVGAPDEMHVYPNFANVMKYSMLATNERVAQMGIRKQRRRGEGVEFHQLREYRSGDSLRQIDWKATSRTRKLISRDYQEERDQRIVFLIDCGRRMRAEDGRLSEFDHTLNAVLLLSHVALRQGDAVGLMTFGGVERWIAPRRSVSRANVILNGIYDIEPTLHAADYSSAALALLKRQPRRALIVVVSNLRDEDSDDLLPALALLKRHHLVLFASMRETAVEEIVERMASGFEPALEQAAAHQYLHYRQRAHEALSHTGVLTLDVSPENLPVAVVNRYFDIKRGGLL